MLISGIWSLYFGYIEKKLLENINSFKLLHCPGLGSRKSETGNRNKMYINSDDVFVFKVLILNNLIQKLKTTESIYWALLVQSTILDSLYIFWGKKIKNSKEWSNRKKNWVIIVTYPLIHAKVSGVLVNV